MKYFVFGLGALIILILATATVLEKFFGSAFSFRYIYGSVPFLLLWGILALGALLYLFKQNTHKRFITFSIHLAFILILAGAGITRYFGRQGIVHLRLNDNINYFTNSCGEIYYFPFTISLSGFKIDYYPGTDSPMDYVSTLKINNMENYEHSGIVSMNHIYSYNGYRFYQAGYDDDGMGTRLSVSYDPYGIAVTYSGYLFLILSLLLFFVEKKSYFRQLINHPVLKRSTLLVVFFTCFGFAYGKPVSGKVLPLKQASEFGNLCVLYNGRICPVQTLAKDFTVKLYGKSHFNGYTAEQVLTGWMFFYTYWEHQPLIRIKDSKVREILGINGKYASYNDFFNNNNQYKLADIIKRIQNGELSELRRGVDEANEKFNLVNMLYSGQLLRIFPVRGEDNSSIVWYAPADNLPVGIDNNRWIFIKKTLDYSFEMVIKKDYKNFSFLIDKLAGFQKKEAGEFLPFQTYLKAEKIYNSLDFTFLLSILCNVTGILFFIWFIYLYINQRKPLIFVLWIAKFFTVIVFFYLSISLALRFYISKHFPLSSGFETMQFMSWCGFLFTLLFHRRFFLVFPFGIITGGLTLLVAALGEMNPQITLLMPILNSPLLSIHVVVIMLAYTLLAFAMLNGVTAIIVKYRNPYSGQQIEQLKIISNILLYPAIFLLVTGVFIGAVWANISWGRYWGWDPKEVWALITFMVYAAILHPDSLPWFRKPLNFHIYTVVAFLTVIITYFGVNFILGGLHAYAAR